MRLRIRVYDMAKSSIEAGQLETSSLMVTRQRSLINRTLHVGRRWPVLPIVVLAVVIVAAIFAPLLTPHDPTIGNLRDRFTPPMWQEGGTSRYPLGTDENGRDILTRVIHGGRITLIVATTVLLSGLILGTTLGLTAGYIGGQVDELIMRIVDFTLAFPFILVAVAVVVVFGASVPLIIILLVIFGWGGFARQARAMTLSLKTADYVAISRIAGASTPRILFRHILPGIMNTMMVLASLAVGGVILAEATLSFLGVGVPRPNPAWGLMVSSGRDYIRDAWWLVVMPGVAIFAVVFSINFLGDWLRDRFDPRLRQL